MRYLVSTRSMSAADRISRSEIGSNRSNGARYSACGRQSAHDRLGARQIASLTKAAVAPSLISYGSIRWHTSSCARWYASHCTGCLYGCCEGTVRLELSVRWTGAISMVSGLGRCLRLVTWCRKSGCRAGYGDNVSGSGVNRGLPKGSSRALSLQCNHHNKEGTR